MNITFDWDEVNSLITILQTKGVCYLMGSGVSLSHLPSPDSGYERDGLLALQEYEQQRYGVPLNFLDDWQNQINHLLAQEEAYHRELPDEVRKALVELSNKELADQMF